MQFRDLGKQYEALENRINSAFISVAKKGSFINGEWIVALENSLSEYVEVDNCITCANGTDALLLSMMACGVGKNDAVFVPDFTFFSSGEAVSIVGAMPVFVDVEKDTFNMSPTSLEKKIEEVRHEGKYNPKAIIAVDLFGLPADYAKISEIAKKYNLLLCEDGAQGFGGNIQGEKSCSFGDISTTSFFPAKPLGCYGDGGAIFTNNNDYAETIRSLKNHGKGTNKYDNIRIGMNSRLDSIQAAILQVKFEAFATYELFDINKIAKHYSDNFTRLANLNKITVPIVPTGYYSSWAQYTVKFNDRVTRNVVQDKLRGYGIPSMVYYPKPMHKQVAFTIEQYKDDDYLNTLELCDTVLSLPIHPYMTTEEVDTVTNIIEQIVLGIV